MGFDSHGSQKSVSLAVGIPRGASYLAALLTQLGLPAAEVNTVAEGIELGVCVFWWDKDITALEAARNSRGQIAVITSHRQAAAFGDGAATETTQGFYFSTAGAWIDDRSFFSQLPAWSWRGEQAGTCRRADGSILDGTGIHAIDTPFPFISLPWEFASIELGRTWLYRAYYSSAVGRHYIQIGPNFDTGAMRRLGFELLQRAFHRLGLPLVRVSPMAGAGRDFSIRIDADGFSEPSTESVLRLAKRFQMKFTWFIDVEGWGNNLNWVRRLRDDGQDVQLHCYFHRTYRSYWANRANIRMGRRLLRQHGCDVEAVVSPYGFYYDGHAYALRDEGIRYSSEFAFATDDLPAYPGNCSSAPLQIPSHCGSIGELRQAGFRPDEIMSHFREAVAKLCRQNGMAILYDHPLDRMERHEDGLRVLFEDLLGSGYRHVTMSEYAARWEQRSIPRAVRMSGGRIEVEGRDHSSEFPLEIFPATEAQMAAAPDGAVRGSASVPEDWFAPVMAETVLSMDRLCTKADELSGESCLNWVRSYLALGHKARHLRDRLVGLGRNSNGQKL